MADRRAADLAQLALTGSAKVGAVLPGHLAAFPLSCIAALNLSEKLRRFVILVSIRSWWIRLSVLPEIAGPLQTLETPRLQHRKFAA